MWIEIPTLAPVLLNTSSQPARAVWIEMEGGDEKPKKEEVTACEGCVD